MLGTNSIASTPIASSGKSKLYELLFNITTATSQVITKLINKSFNVELETNPTQTKSVSKSFNVLRQLVVNQYKSVAKNFNTSVGLFVDLMIKGFKLTFTTYIQTSSVVTKQVSKRFNLSTQVVSTGARQFQKLFKVTFRPISRFIFGLDDPSHRTNIWEKYNNIFVKINNSSNPINYISKHVVTLKDYVKHIITWRNN